MHGGDKSKEQLAKELRQAQRRIAELESIETVLGTVDFQQQRFTEQTPDALFCLAYDDVPLCIDLPVAQQTKLFFEGVIVECNLTAALYFGASSVPEVIGKKFSDYYPNGANELDPFVNKFIENYYRLLQYEVEGVLPDGTKLHFLNSGFGMIQDGRLMRVWGTIHDITEQKRAAFALRESEERFQILVEGGFDGVFIHVDWHVVEANQQLADMLGRERSGMIGKNPLDWITPEKRELVLEMVRSENKQVYNMDFVRADGTLLNFEVFARACTYRGQPARIVGLRDVTARKHMENQLRENEATASVLLNAPRDAIALLNRHGEILSQNDRMRKLMGAQDGDCVFDYMPPEILLLRREMLKLVLNSAQPVYWEDQYAGMVFANRLYPVFDAQGQVERVAFYGQDITERKHTEATLEQQRRFEALLSNISASFINLPPDEIDQGIDDALERVGLFLGIDRCSLGRLTDNGSEVVITNAWMPNPVPGVFGSYRLDQYPWLMSPNTNGDALFWTKAEPLPDFITSHELRLFNETGMQQFAAIPVEVGREVKAALYFSNTSTPREFSPGLIDRIYLLGRIFGSAIARQQAEESMRKSAMIIDSTTDAIITTTLDGTITFWNQGAELLYGYRRDEVIGRPISIIYKEKDLPVLESILNQAVVAGRLKGVELTCIDKNGQDVEILLSLTTTKGPDGKITELVGITKDITAQKRLEEKNREALILRAQLDKERELTALKDRFVSTVSHEFRTPLAVIQTSSELLTRYGERLTQDRYHQAHKRIQEQIQHLSKLIEGVLTISRSQNQRIAFSPRLVDLDDFCHMIFEQIQLTDLAQHAFRFISNTPGTSVMVDNHLLQHILTNLLSNAVKYSPAGSTITVEIQYGEDEVIIQVSDEGIGIPDEDHARLFDPFHRAENVGSIEGTGLGLSIAKEYVELHGGHITLESEVGCGSTFTIVLPTR